MLLDNQIKWRRKRLFLQATGQSSGAMVGVANGTPSWAEVETTGFAYPMLNANAEAFTFLTTTPDDLDPREEIGIRVIYSSDSSTSGDAMNWTVLYSALSIDGTLIDPATALDTPIAADTYGSGVAATMKRSPRGIINANTLTYSAQTETITQRYLTFKVTRTLSAATNVFVIGLDIDYQPRRTQETLYLRGRQAERQADQT
jgi:hypothetical protein